MKKILLSIITLSLIAVACRHSDITPNQLLTKDKLPSQLFTITTNKDTVLATANGAFITIPKGALLSEGKTTVALEIKEAYSMEQIILAGLTTQSNGQPLSSGGMIYINAVGGQTIKISKALGIRIPTPYIDKKMQLFKGEEDKTGNINWVKPDSLPPTAQSNALEEGKILFTQNCASCHGIGKDGVGPNLAHILKRTPDKKILYAYTRNNQQVMHDGNFYYRCLYKRWNKAAMTNFPAIETAALDKLYGYIENESNIRNLPALKDEISPCIDSCIQYASIKNGLEKIKDKLSKEKVDLVIRKSIALSTTVFPRNSNQPAAAPSTKEVAVPYNQSLYYQFNIETFGWYNIDLLLKESSGATESSLMVRLQGQYRQNINLYLVIPSVKVMLPGGLLENKAATYGFYTTDGKINLPQNTKAYIFAIGEFEDQLVFSSKEFLTTTQQEFEMSLASVSKEVFNATIKNLPIQDLSFTAINSKNADTLRQIIKELKDVEKIKPQHCDCDCFLAGEEGAWHPESTGLKDTSNYIDFPKK